MELYVNMYSQYKYFYARPYKTSLTVAHHHRVTGGDNTSQHRFVDVYVLGVADGVPPTVRESLIAASTERRIYVFSDMPLSEKILETIDGYYKECHYPVMSLENPCAWLRDSQIPMNNFYTAFTHHTMSEKMFDDVFNRRQDVQFVEYRYVQQRHVTANIYFDDFTKSVYRLALPSASAMLVLIMPQNFVQTGLKQGYFLFDDVDLIVRVYSTHLLSASKTSRGDEVLINEFCTGNKRTINIIRTFFSRMGANNIYTPSENQVVAYDSYLTLVVGDISNINV